MRNNKLLFVLLVCVSLQFSVFSVFAGDHYSNPDYSDPSLYSWMPEMEYVKSETGFSSLEPILPLEEYEYYYDPPSVWVWPEQCNTEWTERREYVRQKIVVDGKYYAERFCQVEGSGEWKPVLLEGPGSEPGTEFQVFGYVKTGQTVADPKLVPYDNAGGWDYVCNTNFQEGKWYLNEARYKILDCPIGEICEPYKRRFCQLENGAWELTEMDTPEGVVKGFVIVRKNSDEHEIVQ